MGGDAFRQDVTAPAVTLQIVIAHVEHLHVCGGAEGAEKSCHT